MVVMYSVIFDDDVSSELVCYPQYFAFFLWKLHQPFVVQFCTPSEGCQTGHSYIIEITLGLTLSFVALLMLLVPHKTLGL